MWNCNSCCGGPRFPRAELKFGGGVVPQLGWTSWVQIGALPPRDPGETGVWSYEEKKQDKVSRLMNGR